MALFRIGLGLLVLSLPVQLAPDFDAFYRQLAPHTVPDFVVELAFWSLPLFATLLIVGFLTRLSTFLCWSGVIVLQQANPQILQGGDVLLKLLLFWSLFLPLGAIWSIDARRQKASPRLRPLTAQLAPWAFTFQIILVYWSAALLKFDPLWTQNGNALFYALNIEHFTTPLGLYLRQFPDLLRVLTFATLGLEFIGPCLLLIPFHRDLLRLIAVLLFLGFHLIGMPALLRIGLFPWVCAVAWLPFIPGSLWNSLKTRLFVAPQDKRTKAKRLPANKAKASGARIWLVLDYGCSLVIIAAFLDVLAWNIASVTGSDSMRWMERHDLLGNVLKLEQRWNMYAPYPRKEHGWLVVPADLANGTQTDLFTGQPLSWEKPGNIGITFGDDHWRRYLSNLFDDRDPEALRHYADYLVQNWNRHHDSTQKIQVVTIVFMKQITLPDLTVTPPEKDVLYFHAF
jgi:hypothetical protein